MELTVRHAFLFLSASTLAAAAIVAACSSSSPNNEPVTDGEEAGSSVIPPGTGPSSSGGPTGPAGTGLATGLPCDVQGVLENRCIACHGGPSEQPAQLLDYDDLVAPSKKDPTKSVAQVALDEMKAKTMPPTPAVAAEPDEIAAFEDWLKGGSKKNPTACTDAPPDGGVGDGGAGDAAAGDGGVKCTSGTTWTQGNNGSALMRPGEACNACHQARGGPNLRIAGTVYPSLHEPNLCNGSPPPVTVIVTDSQNRTFTMPVNAAGNFLTQGGQRPRPPLKAVVSSGGRTRAMVGSITSGDCNTCHSAAGANGAPGRIMAP